MAISVSTNFDVQGTFPNFERDQFDTLDDMATYPETSLDDGHIAYCVADGKTYQYKAANDSDASTGRWREFAAAAQEVTIPEDKIISELSADHDADGITLTPKMLDGQAGADISVPTLSSDDAAESGLICRDELASLNAVKALRGTPLNTGKMEIGTAPEVMSLFPKTATPNADGTVTTEMATTSTDLPAATTSTAGLMTAADKQKLDGLTGAAIQILTQEEYDALTEKSDTTVYFIKG